MPQGKHKPEEIVAKPRQVVTAEITSKLDCCSHGKPRPFSTVNHAMNVLGIRSVSPAQRQLA